MNNRQKEMLNKLQEYAKSKGGKLISTEYINNSSKLIWQCAEGHQWEGTSKVVKDQKHWCMKCHLVTIEKATKLAHKFGGKCLSNNTKGSIGKFNWRCKNGHEFTKTYYLVNKGYWCNECVKNERRNEQFKIIKDYAKSKGGLCLSDEYIDRHVQMKWQCKKGHVWVATSDNVVTKKMWCSLCKKESRKLTE